MSLAVTFHESQYPTRLHENLLEAIRRGHVPGCFLYDSPAQSARWLAYHDAWSPSRTQDRLQSQYDEAFGAAWEGLAGSAMTYVGIGCGGGTKDARCLARGPEGASLTYVAADASPSLVIGASQAATAARPSVTVRPLVLDLLTEPSREDVLGGDVDGPVIWSCLGLLPNLDADFLLPYLRSLMAPADRLLFSGNLSPAPYKESRAEIRPQYDNPEAHAWYVGALAQLGLSSEDVYVELSDRPLTPDGAVWRVECHGILRHSSTAWVFSDTVQLEVGRRLEVFHSDRYLPNVLPGILEGHGLSADQTWTAEDEEEGIYLCAPL